jgi:formate dehydrogenase iron-sulfur subunit
MNINRRTFLRVSAVTVGVAGAAQKAKAERPRQALDTDVAMLNDSTRCIGCRGCQAVCKQVHGLEPTGNDPRYDMPLELNGRNLTLIKLHKGADGKATFIKRQCLHCSIPSCVSVCPVSAFHKRDDGVVTYDANKCIGCRYCMVACPFEVPTFEYDKAAPVVRKCDFCKDLRLAEGRKPACAETCPAGAITFGTRGDLLKEARARIANNPDRYSEHIYGEKEIGGTSVLYLAPKGVSFEDLGLHTYGETPPFERTETFQHSVFKYWIPPVALYGALGLIGFLTGKKREPEGRN